MLFCLHWPRYLYDTYGRFLPLWVMLLMDEPACMVSGDSFSSFIPIKMYCITML